MKWPNWLRRRVAPDYRLVRARALDLPPFDFAVHAIGDECISRNLARDGIWEPFETTVFGRLCQSGDRVLDLGANIGWYSVLAAKLVGSNGMVTAFEPDAANVELLRRNVSMVDCHGVVQVNHCAVSDLHGQMSLYRSGNNLGDHRLFSDGSAREVATVPVTTLDAYYADTRTSLPNIIKSDTQGSEARILRGAAQLLASGWRPLMIIEFWPFGLTRSGDDPMALACQLQALGYRLYEVSEHTPRLRNLQPETLERRMSEDISPQSWGFLNLLCVAEGCTRMNDLVDLIG